MTNKYSQPEGCCICGTKHSTSQFRPWYDHYSEETYCKVFALPSLQGRRGYVCNPCVLFIKRTVHSMDSNTLHSNPRKRLDMKLKGSRRSKVPDIFPPDCNQAPREMGYVARNRRVTPKYVFTGKPYLKRKSSEHAFLKEQALKLLPAQEWTDPKNFMENESGAEADFLFYRTITLKKGKKTLQQKKGESLEEESRENQIFRAAIVKERTVSPFPSSYPSREDSSGKIRVPRQINHQNGHQHDRAYGTRANVQKGKVAIHRGSSSPQNDEDGEETDTSDEIEDEDTVSFEGQFSKCSASPSDVSKPEQFSNCRKRKHTEENDKRVDDKLDCTPVKKKRRCMRMPIKNFKRPTVSFFDCSYWQKFPLCCVTFYGGEGGHIVMQPHENMTTCPRKAACLAKEVMLRQPFKKKTPPKKKTLSTRSNKAETAGAKDVASCVHRACSKEQNDSSYISTQNGSYNDSFGDGQIAGFHNDQNGSIDNSASASFSDNQSDSFSDNQSEGSSDTHSAMSLKVLRLQGADSASAKFSEEFDLESILSADGGFNYQDDMEGLYVDFESESSVLPDLQNSPDGASTSLQVGIPDSDSGSEKKTRADQESVVSSGDEEPNENRITCTDSPLISEKPCKFF